jgi:hypothetical protein
MNVIGFKELAGDDSGHFFHWAFRERFPAELRPIVKLGVTYRVHPGIAKALNIGKSMKSLFKKF